MARKPYIMLQWITKIKSQPLPLAAVGFCQLSANSLELIKYGITCMELYLNQMNNIVIGHLQNHIMVTVR